jgi:DNA primase
MLSQYADRILMLFDPDAAGEKAVEKAEGVAELSLKAMKRNTFLYVVRLPKDPADWLLEHPASEFDAFLEDAVPVMEYIIRSRAKQATGKDGATRHRTMPAILDYVMEIETEAPTLESEAKRLAADALQVSAVRLESLLASHKSTPTHDERRNIRVAEPFYSYSQASSYGQSPDIVSGDPLLEAGRELLALMFARPDLAVKPLREGVGAPALQQPLVLESVDFADDAHASVFALLREHAGEDLGAVFSAERARSLLDEIGALQAAGEKLYPSDTSLRAAWLRVGALSRERAKTLAEDMDEKFRLHEEIKRLNRAAVEIGNLTLES